MELIVVGMVAWMLVLSLVGLAIVVWVVRERRKALRAYGQRNPTIARRGGRVSIVRASCEKRRSRESA